MLAVPLRRRFYGISARSVDRHLQCLDPSPQLRALLLRRTGRAAAALSAPLREAGGATCPRAAAKADDAVADGSGREETRSGGGGARGCGLAASAWRHDGCCSEGGGRAARLPPRMAPVSARASLSLPFGSEFSDRIDHSFHSLFFFKKYTTALD
jgi:hypothetical protein